MPNPLFQALGGQRQQMPNPAEYRQRIDGQISAFRQQGRNPTSEFEQLMQSGTISADQLAYIRQLGHAVASRLYGGK